MGVYWCTTADKTAGEAAGGPIQPVVTSTVVGAGTTALDNGKDAGGTDSLTSVTATYGGARSGDCGTTINTASALIPSLILPGAVVNSREVFSGTTDPSHVNTSLLAPTKFAFSGDIANHYVMQTCATVPSTSGTGFHYESDMNHTLSNHDYIGLGSHYDFSTSKWYYCPQGCSSWKAMTLTEANGTVHTTLPFPAGHHIYMEWYYHRTSNCSSSSGANCEFYDNACFKDITAGTSQICGVWEDASTGLPPGGIPINLPGFTANEINTQTQLDFNGNFTGSVNIDFKNLVAFTEGVAPPTVSVILIQ